MTLWLYVHGGYPSYQESGAQWRNTDYDAFKLVQALKGKPIKGYVTLKGRRFTTANPAPAFTIFGDWGASVLAKIGGTGYLAPVPSASATTLEGDPKGASLAAAVANLAPSYVALDTFCWQEAMPKSSQGGSRHQQTLFNNLKVRSGLEPQNFVLIDDVVSTGSHLLACARALRHFGHTVEHAIVAAQTVWNHPPSGMFDIAPRDLEADPYDF